MKNKCVIYDKNQIIAEMLKYGALINKNNNKDKNNNSNIGCD